MSGFFNYPVITGGGGGGSGIDAVARANAAAALQLAQEVDEEQTAFETRADADAAVQAGTLTLVEQETHVTIWNEDGFDGVYLYATVPGDPGPSFIPVFNNVTDAGTVTDFDYTAQDW